MSELRLQPVVKRTYDDYAKVPPDLQRLELIDGEFYVTPSPTWVHQRISIQLAQQLMSALEGSHVALVIAAPMDVILSKVDTIQPDIAVLRKERMNLVTARGIEGPPDLVVEILSPSSKVQDRSVKRALYARHRVPEFWLVDPDAKTVEVLVLGAHEYDRHAVFGERDTLLSQQFEQIRIPLERIFAQPL